MVDIGSRVLEWIHRWKSYVSVACRLCRASYTNKRYVQNKTGFPETPLQALNNISKIEGIEGCESLRKPEPWERSRAFQIIFSMLVTFWELWQGCWPFPTTPSKVRFDKIYHKGQLQVRGIASEFMQSYIISSPRIVWVGPRLDLTVNFVSVEELEESSHLSHVSERATGIYSPCSTMFRIHYVHPYSHFKILCISHLRPRCLQLEGQHDAGGPVPHWQSLQGPPVRLRT